MDEATWARLMNTDSSSLTQTQESNITDQLKRRVTFIKFKLSGRTYSRIYYLTLAEDAIHYIGSKTKTKKEACKIKDIDQIRQGFTTDVWKKCLDKRKITHNQQSFAFSILYHNNRHSINLLAESEHICLQWVRGLEYLINRYQFHMRTHKEITNQWIWYLFSQADRDQSGQLSRKEICRLLMSINIELEENDIDNYFRQANIRKGNDKDSAHLDKDEFLIFYKFISYRPELLDIICRFNASTPEEATQTLSEYSVLQVLHKTGPMERPHTSSLNFKKSKNKSSKSNTSSQKNYLTAEQLKVFLENEQQIKPLSIEDCSKLILQFEPSTEGKTYLEMSVDGFRLMLLHDEFCLMNTSKSLKIYHDMTRPITDYFIATSHNTYIRDNQVYGDCTPETYVHALRTGCRAVEMDCYDGDDVGPIVYHGYTLTKPIPFRDIIMAIKTAAFAVSPYPVFLNIENHCSYEQQGTMARMLKDVFRDHLLSKPLVDEFETLPSPEDLKYKIIIRSRRSLKGKPSSVRQYDRDTDNIESSSKRYHPEFANLIVYSEIVSFTNTLNVLSTQKCFHSISLKESKANELINQRPPDHLDLIRLTQKHLIRVYPGSIRQDSSNINPPDYWTYGVQMVALNYQANDRSMFLQHAMFSDNGGCGYLLKPSFLLSKTQLFDPKRGHFEKGKHLEIHIISGQHLPKEKASTEHKDIADPYVQVNTYGIEHDTTEHHTPSVRNNGLNPIWDYKMGVDIFCPELCLILFQVRDADRFGRSKFLGQACVPFTSLQLGYRHVKLRAKNSDYTHGTLFVHIHIKDF